MSGFILPVCRRFSCATAPCERGSYTISMCTSVIYAADGMAVSGYSIVASPVLDCNDHGWISDFVTCAPVLFSLMVYW